MSIHCVPKKDAEGNYTLFRVIRNGKFHTKNTININSLIRKSKCKMPTLPNLRKYAKVFMKNACAALRDLADAFRQIPLNIEDQEFIIYSVFGMVWKDCYQPYGVSSAPSNCQYFVSLIVWILENKIFDEKWKGNTLVHMDDFVLAAKTKEECKDMEEKFDKLTDELGVILSKKIHSYVHATDIVTVYGIVWNLTNKTCSIPDKKLKRFKQYLYYAMKYRTVTGAVLDYISGNIMYFSQLNPLAKPLCMRLMKYIIANLRDINYKPSNIYILPLDILYDFKFWFIYVDLVKNIPIINILQTSIISITGSTDASDKSAGWIIGNKWSFYNFNDNDKHLFIYQKEFHCVLSAINTLKSELTGQTVHLCIDNLIVVTTLIKKWTFNYNLMMFLYELCHILIKYKILIKVDWISSATNILSDSLSRDDFDSFWDEITLHNLIVDPAPINTLYYNDYNYIQKFDMPNNDIKNEYFKFINFIETPSYKLKNKSYTNYGNNFKIENII